MKHGADVNASGGQHGSPLDSATSRNEGRDIIELLLDFGLTIRECDLVAAASKRYDSRYLKFFSEHDKTLQVTEPVIIAAGYIEWDVETLQLLF